MFSTTLLAVIICSLKVDQAHGSEGKLRIYSFPVGQGDAQLIECPDGQLTVVDLGRKAEANQGFWDTTELRGYFRGKYGKIRNIVITHNHDDHYNLIPSVLRGSDGMNNLRNIYISKTDEELPPTLQNWINEIRGASKIRTFNRGNQCGANDVPCGVLDLCPNTPIVAKVLSVNAGRTCRQTNENINSIVFSVNYYRVKVHMNGDFEDCSPNDWNGAQRQLVTYYGRELETTVYKLAHHGASNLANKKVMRDAVKPKAIFVSGNPSYQYHHPRCDIINAFIQEVGTLCEPGNQNPRSSLYCGPNPFAGRSDSIAQQTYTCGDERGCKRIVQGNKLAIYTTVPDGKSLNIIEFVTDGTHWGFINNFVQRNSRGRISESEPAVCNVGSMKPDSTAGIFKKYGWSRHLFG